MLWRDQNGDRILNRTGDIWAVTAPGEADGDPSVGSAVQAEEPSPHRSRDWRQRGPLVLARRPCPAPPQAPRVQPVLLKLLPLFLQNQPQASIALLSHPSCGGGAAVLVRLFNDKQPFCPHLNTQQMLLGPLPWRRPEGCQPLLCQVLSSVS